MKPNAVGHDMDWRFSTGHWSRAGGNMQSLVFYHAMEEQLEALQTPVPGYTWHDYGCAEGDGLAYLAMREPSWRYKGFDICPSAIGRALDRWHAPNLEFELGDVLDASQRADVISSLHTFEHLADPIGAAENLLELTKTLLLVVPRITEENNGGHDGAMLTDELAAGLYELSDNVLGVDYVTYRLDAWTGRRIGEQNVLFRITR